MHGECTYVVPCISMKVKTRALGHAVASLALGLALGACSASDERADGPPAGASEGSDVTLIRPGSPGEEAETGGPATPVEQAPWNHSDLAFVQMMVPHHAQAMTMSRLALRHAASPDVRRLAERIKASQGPEILLMASWLEEQGVQVPSAAEDPTSYDHSEHGHDGMEGMLTPAQMRTLAAARGARFDRLFLRGMIAHHAGAVSMANTVAVSGSAVQVAEMAADVSVGQAAEIGRMRDLLRG